MDNNSNFLLKYIPNTITVLSLCCGLSSIRFSIDEDWKTAILLIIFAAIFDFFDGWFASKLKEGSYFGAELDSLSDIISFGVAFGSKFAYRPLPYFTFIFTQSKSPFAQTYTKPTANIITKINASINANSPNS